MILCKRGTESVSGGGFVPCEAGVMSWIDNEIEMRTSSGDIGKLFGRMVTNENGFLPIHPLGNNGVISVVLCAKLYSYVRVFTW